MLSTIVNPTDPITTTTVDVPLPTDLGHNDVLITVYTAASNPKDWSRLVARNEPFNSGDDLAGIVKRLGSNVSSFSVGDRVAAFHPIGQPFGAYAEYAIAPAHTVFRIPEHLSFDEASTIPLVSMTAALTLFRRQGFVPPWHEDCPVKNQNPLLIYAATTALGTYTIKLAKLAGIGPIIAIGGKNSEYVKSLLGENDLFLDYRTGMHEVSHAVRKFVDEKKLTLNHAIDAFSEDKGWVQVSQMLVDGGTLSVFSGSKRYDEAEIPSNVNVVYTFVGSAHEGSYQLNMPKQPPPQEAQGDIAFAADFFRWVEVLLERGEYSGHPYEVIPGGLGGVAEGLSRLRGGRSYGKKFVYQIRSPTDDQGH